MGIFILSVYSPNKIIITNYYNILDAHNGLPLKRVKKKSFRILTALILPFLSFFLFFQ